MAVRKRGKSWIIDYRVNGKRYMRVVGPNKRDAIAAEGKIKAQIREGRFFDRKRIKETTVGELIRRYLDHFRGKSSLPTEEFHLKAILGFFGVAKPVSQIDRSDVDAFQRARLDTTKRDGTPRSNCTINREVATLRRLLNKGVEWEAIEKNPAAGRKMVPERKGRTRFLSVIEAGRLLDACSPHLYPIILCALETGMRRGEILNLRWEDVDLERRILFVGETKTGMPRHVPISTRLGNLRDNYLRFFQAHFFVYRYHLLYRNPAMCQKDLIETPVLPIRHILRKLFRERSLDLLKGRIPSANRNSPKAIGSPFSERLWSFPIHDLPYRNRSAELM